MTKVGIAAAPALSSALCIAIGDVPQLDAVATGNRVEAKLGGAVSQPA